MSKRRPRHPKPDANQGEIKKELEDEGYVVHDVSPLGGDVLDLFVYSPPHKLWLQVEVKTSIRAPFEDDQLHYLARMDAGMPGVPIIVATNADQIKAWFRRWQPFTSAYHDVEEFYPD